MKITPEPLVVRAFDADWALMPSLQATLYRRIQAGEVAFIPFACIGDLSRSHGLDTQKQVALQKADEMQQASRNAVTAKGLDLEATRATWSSSSRHAGTGASRTRVATAR